ncbi:hypothetical protein EYZ11_002150 [Aspergillus tanneri]|uniref:Uncharacterized protein n=1 Tax=Aspergillus tanneri TaxID=1220188 RepID=A0A4S3JRG4_9EURO|nr:hypothetical protein EYZ11_002150 [Aspergillus tanneri]
MHSRSNVKTGFFVILNTHGRKLPQEYVNNQQADVTIHCGNHDITLDAPMLQQKISEANKPLDPTLVKKEYGDYERPGVFLFRLKIPNGALLTVYAIPYTPSLGDWGFQYHPEQGHIFSIDNADIVTTHGPPKDVMDYTISWGPRSYFRLFRERGHECTASDMFMSNRGRSL